MQEKPGIEQVLKSQIISCLMFNYFIIMVFCKIELYIFIPGLYVHFVDIKCMDKTFKLVVFRLDEQLFSLHLINVDRILPAIEIHPLPMAPEYIMGTINFHGQFLPVVNLRNLFMLPQRELELTDQLIITTTTNYQVALWVDQVKEIVEINTEEISNTEKILLDVDYIHGLFKLNNGMVLIHDIESFLTPEQTARLHVALSKKKEQENTKRKPKDARRKENQS
jgi:purine-binding chemotaxis protein CheW